MLVLALAVMASNHLSAQTNDTVTINLKNADIRSLIETVSLQTGKNFIIDPRVKATVTVISSSPITKDELSTDYFFLCLMCMDLPLCLQGV